MMILYIFIIIMSNLVQISRTVVTDSKLAVAWSETGHSFLGKLEKLVQPVEQGQQCRRGFDRVLWNF